MYIKLVVITFAFSELKIIIADCKRTAKIPILKRAVQLQRSKLNTTHLGISKFDSSTGL